MHQYSLSNEILKTRNFTKNILHGFIITFATKKKNAFSGGCYFNFLSITHNTPVQTTRCDKLFQLLKEFF